MKNEPKGREVTAEQIRSFRLRAHHLDREYGMEEVLEAAGACGFQNSPPGAWETALWNRVPSCGREEMERLLYREKSLLQAWSLRGVPLVFPAGETGAFLSALIPQGKEPWIYTRGIQLALDFVGLEFEETLEALRQVIGELDHQTLVSKTELDQTLAERMLPLLPEEKRFLWSQPSMYGNPEKQTVGGAAVSFLLRPCAFEGRVVFGERKGASPSFTSYENWTGRPFEADGDGGKKLVRKFLHCYGPATADMLAAWLGCSGVQARRLWKLAAGELEPVMFQGKRAFILAEDGETLWGKPVFERQLLLLGGHDPYLDQRDRQVLQPEKSLQRQIWRTVANPGAVIVQGKAVGIWTAVQGGKGKGLRFQASLWEDGVSRNAIRELAEAYGAFRGEEIGEFEVK